jgi:hypothetical protein
MWNFLSEIVRTIIPISSQAVSVQANVALNIAGRPAGKRLAHRNLSTSDCQTRGGTAATVRSNSGGPILSHYQFNHDTPPPLKASDLTVNESQRQSLAVHANYLKLWK